MSWIIDHRARPVAKKSKGIVAACMASALASHDPAAA
jgi:hypothetical protein